MAWGRTHGPFNVSCAARRLDGTDCVRSESNGAGSLGLTAATARLLAIASATAAATRPMLLARPDKQLRRVCLQLGSVRFGRGSPRPGRCLLTLPSGVRRRPLRPTPTGAPSRSEASYP